MDPSAAISSEITHLVALSPPPNIDLSKCTTVQLNCDTTPHHLSVLGASSPLWIQGGLCHWQETPLDSGLPSWELGAGSWELPSPPLPPHPLPVLLPRQSPLCKATLPPPPSALLRIPSGLTLTLAPYLSPLPS